MKPAARVLPSYIECIVRTSDGGFESSLRLPVDSTAEQREGLAKMWIEMLAGAMKNIAQSDPGHP